MPFGRSERKKEVAQGVVLPPDNNTTYAGKPIPPDYAKVVVAWMNTEFEEDELDIPMEVHRWNYRLVHAMEQE